MIPAPHPRAQGAATSADGTGIAWYRAALAEHIVATMPSARLEFLLNRS